MMFVVGEELRLLSELFHKKKSCLYIVGGYVRNKIIGIPDNQNLDVDLCSKSTPEEILNILKDSYFEIENIDNTFGVVKIKGKDNIYEHATFRTEKYDLAGAHNPSNIEFIDNLELDAIRRDFRCNSVYYDIYKDEVQDPLNGVKDIKNRIIKTTIRPEAVFNDDSERILRLIRQAVTLGFRIDKQTFEYARRNAFKIKYLSKNRIKKEFEQILLADYKYTNLKDTKYAHARGVELLGEVGALPYILPTLAQIYNMDVREDRGRNLFNHIIETFKICKESNLQLRYALLMHDYGRFQALLKNNNFNHHQEFSYINIEKDLGSEGLSYNKKFVDDVIEIVECMDYNKFGFETGVKIRRFILNHYLQISNILLLKKYILLNKYGKLDFGYKRLYKGYLSMQQDKYPKTIKQLCLTPTEIINEFPQINKKYMTEIMNQLLYIVIANYRKNSKVKLLKEVEGLIKKNKKYVLEVI